MRNELVPTLPTCNVLAEHYLPLRECEVLPVSNINEAVQNSISAKIHSNFKDSPFEREIPPHARAKGTCI